MSRAGAGILSEYGARLAGLRDDEQPEVGSRVIRALRVPLLKRAERREQERARQDALRRVMQMRLMHARRPKMEVPKASAKRSRNVQLAQARGDGPGMTNPHRFEQFALA